jgi:hypothetical protein
MLLVQAKPSTIARLSDGARLLAIAAAGLAIFSVFQPAFGLPDGHQMIETPYKEVLGPNSLLERSAAGVTILIGAIGIIALACLSRVHGRRATAWGMAIVLLGATIYGATIYQTTEGRDWIEEGNNLLMLVQYPHAPPALGIHAARWAGALAVLAGLALAYLGLLTGPHPWDKKTGLSNDRAVPDRL